MPEDNAPAAAVADCPLCGERMRALERVASRHTPASVPEGAEDAAEHSQVRRYTVVECARGHRLAMTEFGYESIKTTLWDYPREPNRRAR